jgi:hypothetical protein
MTKETSPFPGTSPLDAGLELLAEENRNASFRVRDQSMLPTLPPDSTIQVTLSGSPARFGDLLVFRQADYYAVHRLLGRGRAVDGIEYLRTRGDAVSVLDPPLDPARIVGQVVSFSRAGQWRTLCGGAPRTYARAVALHGLFWAGAAALLSRFEGLRACAVWLDRTLLSGFDALLFPLFHRRISPPAARPCG